MRGPDFFIVGAPKSGTTALANYLGQHPDIGMCERKETQYFASDLRSRFVIKAGQRAPTHDQYLEMFRFVQDRQRLGEASVWYLYSSAAAREIKQSSPDAQIIVMLRNPVDMIPALHSEFVLQELEPVADLGTALALDEMRQRHGTPAGFPPHSYRAATRYAEQIDRYVKALGRERVHVILFEDFRTDTLGVTRTTYEWLGVDSAFMPEIMVINPNRRARSRRMQRLLRRPPEPLRRVLHTVTTQKARRRLGSILLSWNRQVAPRDPIPPHVAASLAPEVEREVEALRDALGIDAGGWLRRATELASTGPGARG